MSDLGTKARLLLIAQHLGLEFTSSSSSSDGTYFVGLRGKKSRPVDECSVAMKMDPSTGREWVEEDPLPVPSAPWRDLPIPIPWAYGLKVRRRGDSVTYVCTDIARTIVALNGPSAGRAVRCSDTAFDSSLWEVVPDA